MHALQELSVRRHRFSTSLMLQVMTMLTSDKNCETADNTYYVKLGEVVQVRGLMGTVESGGKWRELFCVTSSSPGFAAIRSVDIYPLLRARKGGKVNLLSYISCIVAVPPPARAQGGKKLGRCA